LRRQIVIPGVRYITFCDMVYGVLYISRSLYTGFLIYTVRCTRGPLYRPFVIHPCKFWKIQSLITGISGYMLSTTLSQDITDHSPSRRDLHPKTRRRRISGLTQIQNKTSLNSLSASRVLLNWSMYVYWSMPVNISELLRVHVYWSMLFK
jgi:hypothetical protein